MVVVKRQPWRFNAKCPTYGDICHERQQARTGAPPDVLLYLASAGLVLDDRHLIQIPSFPTNDPIFGL